MALRWCLVQLLLIYAVEMIAPVKGTCILPAHNNNSEKPFPDIFHLSGFSTYSYELFTDINDLVKEEQYFVMEYFDDSQGSGRLDIMHNKNKYSNLYFHGSGEYFSFDTINCNSSSIDKQQDLIKGEASVWINHEKDRTIIGPSSILRKGYLDYLNGDVVYEKTTYIDKIAAETWITCLGDFSLTYYFTPKNWTNPYGFKEMQFPMKAVIAGSEGSNNEILTYDFRTFQPYVLNNNVFKVPSGLGCVRSKDDLPVLPDFSSPDYAFYGELVYINLQEDMSTEFISYINIVYSSILSHLSYSFTDWFKKNNSTMDSGDYLFQIFDMENKYLYTVDTEKSSCSMIKSENFKPVSSLPDGGVFHFSTSETLFHSSGFKYINEEIERGFEVLNFEKTTDLTFWPDQQKQKAVITQSYLKKKYKYTAKRGDELTPIKIVIRLISSSNELSAKLVFNIVEFSTAVDDKLDMFDITSCFKDPANSRWMQFDFPVEKEYFSSLFLQEEEIKTAVLKGLNSFLPINGIRVPKIEIEFDANYMYVSMLLLERALFTLDFDSLSGVKVQDPEVAIAFIDSFECAKECLESSKICWGYSYCGAYCYLSTTGIQKEHLIEDEDCVTFSRDSVNKRVWTSDQIVNDISMELESRGFQIELFIKDKPEEFSANNFIGSVNKRPTGRYTKDIMEVDQHFYIYNSSSSLISSADGIKKLGESSYDTCHDLCLGDLSCQSFSFCLTDRTCNQAAHHGSNIPSESMLHDDFCVIMSRRYIDKFSRLLGITWGDKDDTKLIVKHAEECAKACVEEKSFKCQSFDNCRTEVSLETNGYECLLHREHGLDQTGLKPSDSKISNCGHYSLNYVYDFKVFHNKRIMESNPEVHSVSIEMCAKTCLEDSTCANFDFCQISPKNTQSDKAPIQTICVLSSKSEDEITLSYSPICNHYSTSSFITKTKKTNGYGAGLVGGMGFFFFLFGIGMALVIVLAYRWFKSRNN